MLDKISEAVTVFCLGVGSSMDGTCLRKYRRGISSTDLRVTGALVALQCHIVTWQTRSGVLLINNGQMIGGNTVA